MPETMDFEYTPGKTFKIWNTTVRVGQRGYKNGIDVKFCQYLMTWTYKKSGFTISDVTGAWTAKSAAMLKRLEAKNEVVADGCIDRMKDRSGAGSRSHKAYKLFLLQQGYVQQKTGMSMGDLLATGTFGPNDIQDLLMNIPEENADVPADLKWALVGARDGKLEM